MSKKGKARRRKEIKKRLLQNEKKDDFYSTLTGDGSINDYQQIPNHRVITTSALGVLFSIPCVYSYGDRVDGGHKGRYEIWFPKSKLVYFWETILFSKWIIKEKRASIKSIMEGAVMLRNKDGESIRVSFDSFDIPRATDYSEDDVPF
jgi:hypothetical protein